MARSLRAEGYSVWANIEASGTTTKEVSRPTTQLTRSFVPFNIILYFHPYPSPIITPCPRPHLPLLCPTHPQLLTHQPKIRDISNDQLLRAGVNVVSLFAIVCDLMRDWRHTPGSTELLPWLDRYMPAYGMVARGHRAAIESGEIIPGEEVLPK